MGAKGIIWYYPDYCPRPSESLGNCENSPINIFGERTEFFDWLSVYLSAGQLVLFRLGR